jgi:hypothetical protein
MKAENIASKFLNTEKIKNDFLETLAGYFTNDCWRVR